jgi:hypothetical protein
MGLVWKRSFSSGSTGWVYAVLSGHNWVVSGEPEISIDRLARAMRLSPLDPDMFLIQLGLAVAHFISGHYDEAACAEKSLRQNPHFSPAARFIIASYAMAGRDTEAQKALAVLRELDPALRISNLTERSAPFRRPQDAAGLEQGLRKAGLPE